MAQYIFEKGYKNDSSLVKVKLLLIHFEDENNVLVKVKKIFFGSLGRFYPITNLKESLLYTNYKNNDTISSFDKNILKTHYNYIYPHKVDFDLFKNIESK